MLKSLFPKVNWSSVKVVGFDMDGTLYDELDFIVQVYKPISIYLSHTCLGNQPDIYDWMVNRWLDKGSSYNRIFDEVLVYHGIEGDKKKYIILKCLEIFRTFKPNITLPVRTQTLLDIFVKRFEVFLITDGSKALQNAKIAALGLRNWIAEENIVITGGYGEKYYKPSKLCVSKIKMLNKDIKPNEVVFFGDRKVDFKLANNIGYQFVYVNCFFNVVQEKI